MDEFIQWFMQEDRFGTSFARRDVPAKKIEKFRGKLPDKLLEYWQAYGWCGYAQGLFWTVDPDEWEDARDAWIGDTPFVERDHYHVIARSAFGELLFWGEKTGQSLSVTSIRGWIFPTFHAERFSKFGPEKLLPVFFASLSPHAFDEEDENDKPLFKRALAKLGPLDHHTMYGFVPALALGGPEKLEHLKIVEAHTHLDILSQVTEREIMRDIAADARAAGL